MEVDEPRDVVVIENDVVWKVMTVSQSSEAERYPFVAELGVRRKDTRRIKTFVPESKHHRRKEGQWCDWSRRKRKIMIQRPRQRANLIKRWKS